MKLIKVTDRVWYYPLDDEKDRPILGYIRGSRFSVAVDAGHSAEHVQEFYNAVREEGMPLPQLTVITHWHWDHTFGMHAVNGQTMASRRTRGHLEELIRDHGSDMLEHVVSLDPFTEAEYASGQPVKVVLPDMVYEDSAMIDAGSLEIEVMEAVSPHTDDSTLIYIPQEKCLFLGDAVLGNFPSGEVDPEKMDRLIAAVQRLDFTYALTGHWEMSTKEKLLADMQARAFD